MGEQWKEHRTDKSSLNLQGMNREIMAKVALRKFQHFGHVLKVVHES